VVAASAPGGGGALLQRDGHRRGAGESRRVRRGVVARAPRARGARPGVQRLDDGHAPALRAGCRGEVEQEARRPLRPAAGCVRGRWAAIHRRSRLDRKVSSVPDHIEKNIVVIDSEIH
jgi:hypothetical protein